MDIDPFGPVDETETERYIREHIGLECAAWAYAARKCWERQEYNSGRRAAMECVNFTLLYGMQQQQYQHYQHDQTQAAAAVVAQAGTHAVAANTEDEQQNDQQNKHDDCSPKKERAL